jgi:Spy/CpxP family protein refolding chaperone
VRPVLGPRAQAVLVLLLVATIGALSGILADRYVAAQRTGTPMQQGMDRTRMTMSPGFRYGEGLTMSLDLSADQRIRIDSILAENRTRARELTLQYQPQFRALASQTRERVEAVLTPEQREQLRALRQQRMRSGRDMRPGEMRPGDVRPNDMQPRRMPPRETVPEL